MEIQLANSFMHNHDLGCGCRDPLLHTLVLLLENKIDSTITQETKDKIKCLLTEDTGFNLTATDGGDQEEDGFKEGDLEELFKEDFDDGDG